MCFDVKSYIPTVRRTPVPSRKWLNVGQPASGVAWRVRVITSVTGVSETPAGAVYDTDGFWARPAGRAAADNGAGGFAAPFTVRSKGNGGGAHPGRAAAKAACAAGSVCRRRSSGDASRTSVAIPPTFGGIFCWAETFSRFLSTVTTIAGLSVIQPPVNLNPGRTASTFALRN